MRQSPALFVRTNFVVVLHDAPVRSELVVILHLLLDVHFNALLNVRARQSGRRYIKRGLEALTKRRWSNLDLLLDRHSLERILAMPVNTNNNISTN